MVNKGRIDALKSFWDKEGEGLGGIDAAIPEYAGGQLRISLLQVAASVGQESIVQWALEEHRADPTIEVPSSASSKTGPEDEVLPILEADEDQQQPTSIGGRRTAYDISHSRAIRDVFRRCAGDHPDWWDWFGAAHVPSALSKEKEAERDEKKKVRRKGLKDRVKEREKKPSVEENVAREAPVPVKQVEKPSEGPQKLGGAKTASEGLAGLTGEMRAKVERERRARAAEARLKG